MRIMTTKEKAEQLWSKFSNTCGSWVEGRRCAIISVDEILESVGLVNYGKYESKMDFTEFFKYWQEVKQHLEEVL